jgi:nitrogen regulatory protein P-II 1
MKKMEAIIQPSKLDAVKEALYEVGIQGMTVSEVRGHGRQKGHSEIYRGHEYTVDLLPKLKVEVVMPDAVAAHAVEAVIKAAHSGKIGDGKVFLSDVSEAARIRDNQRGDEAL